MACKTSTVRKQVRVWSGAAGAGSAQRTTRVCDGTVGAAVATVGGSVTVPGPAICGNTALPDCSSFKVEVRSCDAAGGSKHFRPPAPPPPLAGFFAACTPTHPR
jgi:hypothetical protein